MSKLEVDPNKKTFWFYVCRVLHENPRVGLYSGETPCCFRSLTLIMVNTSDDTINVMPINEWVSNFTSLLWGKHNNNQVVILSDMTNMSVN